MKKLFFILISLFVAYLLLYKYLGGFPVGFHNGRLLIYQYFCSDVCPDYRIWNIYSWNVEYYGIDNKEECQRIKGLSLIDPAWGGYYGCMPNIF